MLWYKLYNGHDANIATLTIQSVNIFRTLIGYGITKSREQVVILEMMQETANMELNIVNIAGLTYLNCEGL